MSIKIEDVEVFGWKKAIKGARNPMNSWEKSDSQFICPDEGTNRWCGDPYIGPNDHKLLMNLCKGGTEEAKWRRMVHVQMDVTAPLYWWKEFETYKVGTVSNSCSTMHKIHAKEFTLDDFSCEHLVDLESDDWNLAAAISMSEIIPVGTGIEQSVMVDIIGRNWNNADPFIMPKDLLRATIKLLNVCRYNFLETKDKKYWWQMIQLLPSSYNQKRTIDLNYEVLAAQYRQRKDHKLDCWHQYCDWIKTLPYSEFITMEDDSDVKIPTLTIEDIKLLRPKYEDFRKSVIDGIIPVNKEVSDWMNIMDRILEEADNIVSHK